MSGRAAMPTGILFTGGRGVRNSTPAWIGYGGAVFGLHLLGLLALLHAARAHPVLVGMGVLAYTLGLRHAFDADHIAAIDNTVRKLIRQGEAPFGVGFYFSLGHSTVVLAMAVLTAVIARWGQQSLPHLQAAGGLIGSTVSGVFLLAVGLINLFSCLDTYLIFLEMRRGPYDAHALEQRLSCGFVVRIASPLFKLINHSWQVYPLGLVFGLGFDTASEVALLALSAGVAVGAVPAAGVVALPVLFAAGMSLMDTADGVFMTTAYRWAFAAPLRKVYYNLTVTGLSVVAALSIGLIELIQVLTQALGLTSGLWGWLRALDFAGIGYVMVTVFVLTWSLSYGAWRWLRLEER
jgi:nickel/cobalt transporter (NiCoT) family protein